MRHELTNDDLDQCCSRTEADRFNDKYQAKKWQLSAAINSMPQGLIMLDGKAGVVAMNGNYRQIYNLPETIQAIGSLVSDRAVAC